MGLSQEELKSINALPNTVQFQHSWKSIRNIITWRERIKKYLILTILLPILSFMITYGLMTLVEKGVLPRSDFMDEFLRFLSCLALFSLVLYFVTILLYSFLLDRWDRKKKRKLRSLYEQEILTPILQALYPSAEVDTEHHIALNTIKEVVPSAKCYIQSGILELHDERDLEIVDLYAFSVEKEENGYDDVTDFLGQVYSIKNPLSLKGKLWIVPTEHFLNFETEDGYLGTMQDGKKIDVEDIQHNEHYNIYCTDEQSARKFLTPTVIEWFNSMTSRRKLSFYINESRIYFANYNDKYFFDAPDDQKKYMAWRIENAARKITYAMDFANEVTEMLHKSEGFS